VWNWNTFSTGWAISTGFKPITCWCRNSGN
jgi:hypothetical protein